MRVALFLTCVTDTLFPEAGRATVEVLERLGHQLVRCLGEQPVRCLITINRTHVAIAIDGRLRSRASASHA